METQSLAEKFFRCWISLATRSVLVTKISDTIASLPKIIKYFKIFYYPINISKIDSNGLAKANTVCNFQSIKSPVELNSLLSKFFCYITWLVISPDWTRHWTTWKRGLYVKSYCFFETIVYWFRNYKLLWAKVLSTNQIPGFFKP